MHRSRLTAAVFLAMALAAAAASAEDLTIDVAVDAAGLSPDVRATEVLCQVCTADCETANSNQIVGQGSVQQSFAPGGRPTFQGTVSVAVHTAKPNATDYMCALHVVNDQHVSMLAGSGDIWTQPAPGTVFVPMLKGKLPSSKSSVATKCKNGAEMVNGKCPSGSGNVASTPAKTCPDGSPMPANGNCGFVGPTIDLPNILKIFTPCPNNQPRKADGTCPASTAGNGSANSQVVLQPCPDGQARMKTGQCPGPKVGISRDNIFRFLQPAPANNGLH